MKFFYTLTLPHLKAWAAYYLKHIQPPGFFGKLLGKGDPDKLGQQLTLTHSLGGRYVEIDEFKMLTETPNGAEPKSVYPSSLKHIGITPDFLFLQKLGTEVLVIPTTAFKEAGSRDAFIAKLIELGPEVKVNREG
jgi:hypothetical protein